MDIATLLGMMGALALAIISVIRQDQVDMFLSDWFSPLFVLCGTLFAVMVRFSLGHFIGSLKVVARAFSGRVKTLKV